MNESILSVLSQGLMLLLTLDDSVWTIIGVSFGVSVKAMAIALPGAILLGFLLALGRFPGRWMVISLFQTLQAVPTVVIGLVVYLLIFRHGPLGDLRWLFTQNAMVLAQVLLAIPILVTLSYGAFANGDWRAWETARTLGASWPRTFFIFSFELRRALLVAVITAFSRIITEVGASMLVGGNILNLTRNITTAIALETSKGQFAEAVALGITLLLLALILNLMLGRLHQRQERLRRG